MSKIIFYDKEHLLGDIFRIAHCTKNESLLFLGNPEADKKTQVVLGVGLVKRIEKGQDFDIVKMSFGWRYWREIIVRDNHARRQIYTLKRGQYAWFFGKRRSYIIGGKLKCTYYATALQGWYVPKNMDIKQIDQSEIDKLSVDNEKEIKKIDELLADDE